MTRNTSSAKKTPRRRRKTEYKDLQGYPVPALDAPEVVGLKNSYQSAFSHYLSGFVYEALGENDLAAPGYRKAAELRRTPRCWSRRCSTWTNLRPEPMTPTC